MIRATTAAAAACILLSGCATITRGSNDALLVESSPPGAQVRTGNGFACDATPCTLQMPRKSITQVSISKEGYWPKQVNVTNTVQGGGGAAMAGNMLVGGIPGMVVDVATGATLSLTPNPVHVDLVPLPGGLGHAARPGQVGVVSRIGVAFFGSTTKENVSLCVRAGADLVLVSDGRCLLAEMTVAEAKTFRRGLSAAIRELEKAIGS